MPIYEECARSNYVRITDPSRWEALCAQLDFTVVTDHRPGETRYGFLCPDGFKGPLKTAEQGEEDLLGQFADLLQYGDVLVVMGSGHEALQFIAGWAVAINHRQERECLDLTAIYQQAAHLGEHVTEAEA